MPLAPEESQSARSEAGGDTVHWTVRLERGTVAVVLHYARCDCCDSDWLASSGLSDPRKAACQAPPSEILLVIVVVVVVVVMVVGKDIEAD